MKDRGFIFMLAILPATVILLIISALFGNKDYYEFMSLTLKIETGVIVMIIIAMLINEFRKTQRLPSKWSCDDDAEPANQPGIREKVPRFLAYALTVLFLIVFAYLCLTAKILIFKPWLDSPYCSLGLFVAAILVIAYDDIQFFRKLFRPTPWQKYADDDEGAKGL